jgi:hypothetical protein
LSNITGRLLNARRQPCHGGYVLTGEVYEDRLGRFHDGKEIRTSLVVSEEGDIVLTAYSIYEVESWAATKED